MKNALAMVAPCDDGTSDAPEVRPLEYSGPVVGYFVEARDGLLEVTDGAGRQIRCELLESSVAVHFESGDRVLLLLPPAAGAFGVVLGKLTTYRPKEVGRHVTVEATESLTLKCGEASIDLRADGKVMVRGEDVLLRAKGTQRIRAGTVSIN